AEMNQISYFAKFWHFGATGRRGSVLHFFSPPQYIARLIFSATGNIYSSRLKSRKLDTSKLKTKNEKLKVGFISTFHFH
ncbi:MAG: hypothetical protein FWC50_00575, partial [Planctomycetaceae bacterium]|nr:hypothetical protein [Planctomycetaceae bacterium]